jgi:hypothetical protein
MPGRVAGTGTPMSSSPVDTSTRGTKRAFALSRAEWATTAVAAVVSSAAYITAGFPYLARGVVGDLAGFVLLGVAGVAVGARLKHEALICLVAVSTRLGPGMTV